MIIVNLNRTLQFAKYAWIKYKILTYGIMHATRQSMTYTTVSGVIIHLFYMRGKLQRNSMTCLQVIDELDSFLSFHDAALIFLITCPPSLFLASLFLGLLYSLPSFRPCFHLIMSWFPPHEWLQILSQHFIIFLSTRALLNIPRQRSYQLLKLNMLMPNHLFVLTSLTLSVTSPTSSPPRHSNNKSSHVMGTWVLYLCCFQKLSTICRAGLFSSFLLVFHIPG